jgi:hypothetical protein
MISLSPQHPHTTILVHTHIHGMNSYAMNKSPAANLMRSTTTTRTASVTAAAAAVASVKQMGFLISLFPPLVDREFIFASHTCITQSVIGDDPAICSPLSAPLSDGSPFKGFTSGTATGQRLLFALPLDPLLLR